MDPYGFTKKTWKTYGQGLSATYHRDKPVVRAYGELVATGGNKSAAQTQGAYAGTLIDPWHVRDVRIPDLASYPTSTLTVETEFLWTPNTSNSSSNTEALYVYVSPNPGYIYAQGLDGTTPGQLTASSTVTNLGGTTITDNFTECRVVSMGVLLKFAGNDSNSQGVLNLVSAPSQPGSSVTGNYNLVNGGEYRAGVSAPTQERVFYTGPLREGGIITYRPYDSTSFQMSVPSTTIGNNQCYGQFAISLQGINTTTPPTMTVHIVCNLEGIQKSNTKGYGAGAIVMDGAALEHGLSTGGQISPVLPADEATMANVAALGMALAASGSSKKRKL